LSKIRKIEKLQTSGHFSYPVLWPPIPCYTYFESSSSDLSNGVPKNAIPASILICQVSRNRDFFDYGLLPMSFGITVILPLILRSPLKFRGDPQHSNHFVFGVGGRGGGNTQITAWVVWGAASFTSTPSTQVTACVLGGVFLCKSRSLGLAYWVDHFGSFWFIFRVILFFVENPKNRKIANFRPFFLSRALTSYPVLYIFWKFTLWSFQRCA